jgi:hypothetical protein
MGNRGCDYSAILVRNQAAALALSEAEASSFPSLPFPLRALPYLPSPMSHDPLAIASLASLARTGFVKRHGSAPNQPTDDDSPRCALRCAPIVALGFSQCCCCCCCEGKPGGGRHEHPWVRLSSHLVRSSHSYGSWPFPPCPALDLTAAALVGRGPPPYGKFNLRSSLALLPIPPILPHPAHLPPFSRLRPIAVGWQVSCS